MSQPFDLSRFPDLPPEVVTAFAAQQTALEAARFEASVERAARQHEQAVVAELTELVTTLEGQVQQYRRAKFGPKSEKLDPAQLELEDLETAIAETEARIAAVEERIAASASDPDEKAPRKPRKARALPDNLPRIERVIEPDTLAWSSLERHLVRATMATRLRRHGPDRRGPHGAARRRPGALPGDRHDPTQIRLPQGPDGRDAGQGAGTSP